MAPDRIDALLVAPQRTLSDRLAGLFSDRPVNVTRIADLEGLIEHFEERTYDLLLIGSAALEEAEADIAAILRVLSERCPVTQVLFLVEAGHFRLVRRVTKGGGFQHVRLPVSDEELRLLVEGALEQRPRFGTNLLLKTDRAPSRYHQLVGRSQAMQEVYRQIRQAASTDIPVLILGQTGTGKDLAAQAIHQQSDRRDRPFIATHIGAMPPDLVASELFGHEKGAFTGALERHIGRFEQGQGGTVFLDEIGTVDEKVQISLLRLIEQKKFNRIGGRRLIACDARLIAATNADLGEAVAQGAFREDLFYRLDVFRIALPPLQERQGDISLLIDEFIRRYNESFQKSIRGIAPECIALLQSHPWPGNVRELKNVIQRAVLVCEGEVIMPEHLPARFGQDQARPTGIFLETGTTLREGERQLILHALAAADNNRTQAAKLLGVSRRALYNKLQRHGLK